MSLGLFVLICVIVSCLLGNAIAVLINIGLFEVWHPLDKPEIVASEILDADYQTIWVRLRDGRIMMRKVDCYAGESQPSSCSQWIETDRVPENLVRQYSLDRSSSCNFGPPPFFTPGNIIECDRAILVGPEYMNTTIYALLENGSIWYWSSSGSSLGPFPASLLCANLISPVIGILIAMIAYSIYSRRKSKVV